MASFKPEYIYLIRTDEFIKSDENIYKVGKTKRSNPLKRISEYSGDVEIYTIVAVNNCTKIEDALIELFKHKYERAKALEYFRGDLHTMMHDVFSVSMSYGSVNVSVNTNTSISNTKIVEIEEHQNIENETENTIEKDVENLCLNHEICELIDLHIIDMPSMQKMGWRKARRGIHEYGSKIMNYNDLINVTNVGPKISKFVDDEFITDSMRLESVSKEDLDMCLNFLEMFIADVEDIDYPWMKYTEKIGISRFEVDKDYDIFEHDEKWKSGEYNIYINSLISICIRSLDKLRKLYNRYLKLCNAVYSKYPIQFYMWMVTNRFNIPYSDIIVDIYHTKYELCILRYFKSYNFDNLELISEDNDIEHICKSLKLSNVDMNILNDKNVTSLLKAKSDIYLLIF